MISRKNIAFTLVELLISISILALVSGYIFYTISGLAEQGNKQKVKLDIDSEISSLVGVIINYIYDADDFKILDSNIKDVKGEKSFNGILIKNASNKYYSSLFTIVKTFTRELIYKELPVYPGENNYFLGITDINLFSDIEYFSGVVLYSDPGNSSIKYKFYKTGISGILFGGEDKNNPLTTPTGLYLGKGYLFISDSNNHVIYRIEKSNLNNLIGSSVSENNSLLKSNIIAGQYKNPGFTDGVYGINTLNKPMGLVMIGDILYIADSGNHVIRTLNIGNGISYGTLDTFVGNGSPGITEDNSMHGDFLLNSPTDIDYSQFDDLLFVSDTNNNRIISFGRQVDSQNAGLNNTLQKPFTMVGMGIKPKDILQSFKINNNSNKTKPQDNTYVGKAGFSGDFSIAASAQLNHPTGIKILFDGSLVICDSGNNLIRKVLPVNIGQVGTLLLSDNNNTIETMIGNPIEISLESGTGKSNVKTSIRAPRGANFNSLPKQSQIDNPMGINFIDGKIILFSSIGNNNVGEIKKYSGDNSVIQTFSEKAFNFIDIDDITFTNLNDYISSNSILKLKFKKVTNNEASSIDKNTPQSLVNIIISAVGYIRSDEPIITDLSTSISPRKIISEHP